MNNNIYKFQFSNLKAISVIFVLTLISILAIRLCRAVNSGDICS